MGHPPGCLKFGTVIRGVPLGLWQRVIAFETVRPEIFLRVILGAKRETGRGPDLVSKPPCEIGRRWEMSTQSACQVGNTKFVKSIIDLALLIFVVTGICVGVVSTGFGQELYTVDETDELIRIETPHLQAAIRKKGYVSGVAAQSFVDRKTGFRDPGFGLDIVDWIMEPGSDEAYRDQIAHTDLVYEFNNLVHGRRAKRSIEGPQICTRARELKPEIIRGKDFVAIRQQFTYHIAAPGRKTGSRWTQIIVFPVDRRYFFSMDRVDSVNDSEAMFLRIDMPGHIRHKEGDTFSEIYLSYHGFLPAREFFRDFPPDEKFDYVRGRDPMPAEFIRACRLRDPHSGALGPWLAGIVLDPSVVYEAWCHQRGYVCMILEFGGRPIRAGESFSAAFVVGYFDTVAEMHEVARYYRGFTALEVSPQGWRLTNRNLGE